MRTVRDLATMFVIALFGCGLRRVGVPISLMAVFTGIVDGITAFEHSRRVLRRCSVECLCRGVMETMRKGDPSTTVLID
jgi:hypothetical protein